MRCVLAVVFALALASRYVRLAWELTKKTDAYVLVLSLTWLPVFKCFGYRVSDVGVRRSKAATVQTVGLTYLRTPTSENYLARYPKRLNTGEVLSWSVYISWK